VIVIEWPLSIALRQRRWRRRLASAALLIALLALNGSRLPNHYHALTSDYGRTVRLVRANYQPGDGVIFHGPWQAIMQYYYPIGDVPYLYLPPQAPPQLDPASTAPQLAEWLRTYRRLWVIPVAVAQADPDHFVDAYLNEHAHRALAETNVGLYYAPVTVQPVTAQPIQFGGLIELSKIEAAPGAVESGEALVTTLTWRTLRPIDGDAQITLDVIDPAGNVWGQRIYRPGEEFVAAAEWNTGESIVDRQAVPIDLGAPPGAYRLRVTVQRASSGELLPPLDQPDPNHAALATVQVSAPRQPIADERVPGVYVEAQIGAGLKLIAYRVPADQFAQGGVVPITLYWRALAGERHVQVDVALNGPDGAPVDVSRGPLGPEWYPADRWRDGEVIATGTALRIPARGTPGDYALNVTVRDGAEQPIVMTGTLAQPGFLWLWTDRVVAQRETWPLGNIHVAARDRDFNRPSAQTPLAVKFGDEVQLIGYDLNIGAGRLRVTYYWQALKSIERNYVVFNHLLDATGAQRGQHDGMPVGGLNPTPFWQMGEYIKDEYLIDLAPDAPAGDYTLDFGWYDSDTGVRLPAMGADGIRYRDDIVKLLHIPVTLP
jgi:hypothetical protein